MTRRTGCLWTFLVAAVLAATLASLHLPVVSPLALGLAVALLLALLLWIAWRILRAFLWRVGRRLAFSYFLIGVLPIPMVGLLLFLTAYLLSGFFLGHLYRDALHGLAQELTFAARHRLEAGPSGRSLGGDDDVAFATYRHGKRLAGSQLAPREYPAWLAPDADASVAPRPERLVALADGKPTLAVLAGDADDAELAIFTGDLAAELARRSRIGVHLFRSDEAEKAPGLNVRIGNRELTLLPMRKEGKTFSTFTVRPAPTTSQPGATVSREPATGTENPEAEHWWRRDLLWWSELSGPLRSLADGEAAADYVGASLTSSPAEVAQQLFSAFPEVDAVAWGSLLAVGFLLFDLYFAAVAMALFMIFTLSRAVNRLSRATTAVRGGDFSTRLPVRRRDQIGELQRTFNEMAEHLEELVATAAQKEALEKELEIARELQRSLLPAELPSTESVEFATYFEPSAAIGGDYFDLLRLDDHRLAVVVADVSGHGLPTGLRMAMVKASLLILAGEGKPPAEILRSLDQMIRTSDERRYFVTCTLALVDLVHGSIELTNAGHPPCYLLRGGACEEIVVPGNPLGMLGRNYGRRTFSIAPGDVVVWLSDGLVEATDGSGAPFGYAGVERALAGPTPSAAAVKERLLGALTVHTGPQPAEDDRTLVVMRYRAEQRGNPGSGDL